MAILNTILYTCAALIGYRIVKYMHAGIYNPLAHIPGPWHTRFSSVVGNYHRVRGTKVAWHHTLHARYGPVVRVQPDRVAASDVESWEAIHRMGSGFRKTWIHEKVRIGPELFLFSFTDVKKHAARRKLFARAFTKEAIRRNWEDVVRQRVEACVEKIKKEAEGGVADVFKWWRLMTSDIIAQMSFGESFGLVESSGQDEGQRAYFEALENAGINITLREVVPFMLPLLAKVLPIRKLKDIVGAHKVVTDKGTIAQHARRGGEDQEDDGAESDLSDNAIRSEAAGFLIAGSDTTSVALTYTIWAILKRPDLQRRLEDEVAGLPVGFGDKDVEQLPLLNNVLDEALRLYNPASGPLIRATPPGGVTFHGNFIPGGTLVFCQMWTVLRNPDMFPDPEKFDERRFENATEKQRRVAQPFGIGSRSCIAAPLAMMELRFGVAMFLRGCKGAMLGKDMTDDMMEQRNRFFNYPKGKRCDITLVRELGQ
ncbi:cytochrome P450 [Apodospora peruviana]|uniref:Cytochrome P450 n=1 Tax=Apodospora peruviana TaxID=516989 RepID=A0AAE0M2V7_9PEZI|nr:cytochrome P450 [Apodospora peruviana]